MNDAAVRMDFRASSETDWSSMWLRQAEHGDVAGLPSLAPEAIQRQLHGTSGVAAMQGALKFRSVVRKHLDEIRPGARMLDFGCGWGRHIRVFLKDFSPGNIVGVDIDPANLALCREHLPQVSFLRSSEDQPLDIAPGSIDLVLSFSVFSHINEASARYWLAELGRIVKPGGTIIVTSWGRSLFEIAARIRATGRVQFEWERNLVKSFSDMDAVEHEYRTGQFQFGRHGSVGGALDPDLYGIALMPAIWIERNTNLIVRHVIEDTQVVPQTTFFLQRHKD